MEEQIKKIEKHDDGYIEVILKRLKDLDEYVFSQMNKDEACLVCSHDPKSKLKLYYDTRGYIELSGYLKVHVFEEQELISFLIFLFEHMIQANTQKPVYLNSEFIFIGYERGNLKFLTLPLTMDKWIFQEEQSKEFLISLIRELRIREGYAGIGYLVEIVKSKELSFPFLLQGLLRLKEQQIKKKAWWKRSMKTVEIYQIEGIPQPIYHAPIEYEEAIMNETMVLFAQPGDAYLMDQSTFQIYPLNQQAFTIGRQQENTLCIKDSYVSSKHAVLYPDEQRLEDLHSSNGTKVNQMPIQEVILQDGDLISIAGHEYVYHCGKEAA